MDSCDFTFDGHHISEFGAVCLISRWPGAARTTANTAAVDGRHGTLRYPGETYGEKRMTGVIYLLSPDEELEELAFTTEGWPSGRAEVTFALQPFAYAGEESAASFTLAANAAQVKTIAVPGNMPAPLLMRLTAAAAVNTAEISEGGSTLRLEGLGLGAGGIVEIGAPLEDGEIMTCKVNGVSAMGKITAASAVPFELAPGPRSLTATADGACAVRAAARGRWK